MFKQMRRNSQTNSPQQESANPPSFGSSTFSPRRLFQRANRNDQNEYETAKRELMASIGGRNNTQIQNRLKNQNKDGRLFNAHEQAQIRLMSRDDLTTEWLQQVGIGTDEEAREYLNRGNYRDWLNLEPGKSLLIQSLAVDRDDQKNKEMPSPAYTRGLRKQIETDGTLSEDQKEAKKQERDGYIRNAFVNTLKERTLPDRVNNLNDEQRREMEQKSARASEILTKIFLILQSGLKIYDQEQRIHIDYREGDVARALAHGGRVNIRIPQLRENENPKDLLDWIGINEQGEDNKSKHVEPVFHRPFSTHHMNIGKNKGGQQGKFEEEGGRVAAIKNVFSHESNHGLNISAGGLGKRDINGEIILPDGAHGHMFIGFTPPTQKKDGALQIGLESTAPGSDSITGYNHTMLSTEATANPESVFHGHKGDKIGGGSLKDNQRYIELNSFQGKTPEKTWLNYLEDVERDWRQCLQENGSQAYEQLVDNTFGYQELVGKRKYFGYNEQKELNKEGAK